MTRRRPPTISDWLGHVNEADVPEWVRRVLRAYAQGHRGGRRMSRPLADVMAELGMSRSAVFKALKIAKDGGILVVAERGIQGRTAVYDGTFAVSKTMGPLGLPSSVRIVRPSEVDPNDCSSFEGGPHYYEPDVMRPGAGRRSALMTSTFSDDGGRELKSILSLSPDREGCEPHLCSGCGGPLDSASIEIGFAVGVCCEVVAYCDADQSETEEELA